MIYTQILRGFKFGHSTCCRMRQTFFKILNRYKCILNLIINCITGFKSDGSRECLAQQRRFAFFHATECTDNNYVVDNCSSAKTQIQHANNCQTSPGQCLDCIRVRIIGRKHYISCRSSVCEVSCLFRFKFILICY